MAPLAVERVVRAYKRKYDIDDTQTAIVRAEIARIFQEMVTTAPATKPETTA